MDDFFDGLKAIFIILGILSVVFFITALIYEIPNRAHEMHVITATGEEIMGEVKIKEWQGQTWIELEDGTMEQVVKNKIIK